MKIHERHGEIIGFDDDYGLPVYIRGHVTPEEAAEALAELCAEECDPEMDGPCEYHRPAELRYRWARWRPVQEDDGHDSEYTWHTRRSPAPGWAKVTRVDTVAHAREREEKRALEYWMRSYVARRWAGAQVVHVCATTKKRRRDAWILFVWRGLRVDFRPFAQKPRATLTPAAESGYMSRVAMLERWHQ
jgi:hypothetical protein